MYIRTTILPLNSYFLHHSLTQQSTRISNQLFNTFFRDNHFLPTFNMKFTASVLALLAVATGALASPHGGPPPPPPPPPPPAPKNNNNNNQGNQCGNGQSLYCCTSSGKNADVECISFTNGGLGGVCNGIQMCCNNNVSTLTS